MALLLLLVLGWMPLTAGAAHGQAGRQLRRLERQIDHLARSRRAVRTNRAELQRLGQQFRGQLSSMVRSLRARGRHRAARNLVRHYSNLAFQLKHGATREAYRQMHQVEATQRAGQDASGLLKDLGRRIGRQEWLTPGSRRLLGRFQRAASLEKYAKLLGTSSPRSTTTAEVELDLDPVHSAGLLQVMNTRDGTIGVLLDAAQRNVRQRKLPRSLGAAQADVQRHAAAEAEVRASGATSWDQVSSGLAGRYKALLRAQIGERYHRAVAQVRQLAGNRDPRTLGWDEIGKHLGSETQYALLAGASAGRGASFFDDRNLPGVVMPQGSRALGRGRNREQVRPGFTGRVEARSPEDADNLHAVELHRRQPGRAGDNSTAAVDWGVHLTGSQTVGHHLHMPFTPRGLVRRRHSGESAMITDHWRRANLFAELRVASRGQPLARVGSDRVTSFDYSSADKVRQVNRVLRGERADTRVSLKMAAVGFRAGIYNDADGARAPRMVGYEARAIDFLPGTETGREQLVRESWLNAIQRSVTTGYYGISNSRFKGWYRQQMGQRGQSEGDLLASLHYNRSVRALVSTAPETVRAALGGNRSLRTAVERAAGSNYGVRMLLHDWSADTIWLDHTPASRTRALRRVQQAQLQALQQIERGVRPEQAVQHFVRHSGLMQAVGRSLGMNDVEPGVLGHLPTPRGNPR